MIEVDGELVELFCDRKDCIFCIGNECITQPEKEGEDCLSFCKKVESRRKSWTQK